MPEHSKEKRRSIAQVNRMIRSIVEFETLEHFFWVRGKIESYYQSDMGHVYFDLVDGRTRIRCMLPERRRGHIPFELHNSIDVEVYGDVQVYEERASVQIQILDARLIGAATNARSTVDQLSEGEDTSPHQPLDKRYLRQLDIIIIVLIALFIALVLSIAVYSLTL